VKKEINLPLKMPKVLYPQTFRMDAPGRPFRLRAVDSLIDLVASSVLIYFTSGTNSADCVGKLE
jgi:hypothetical protein